MLLVCYVFESLSFMASGFRMFPVFLRHESLLIMIIVLNVLSLTPNVLGIILWMELIINQHCSIPLRVMGTVLDGSSGIVSATQSAISVVIAIGLVHISIGSRILT